MDQGKALEDILIGRSRVKIGWVETIVMKGFSFKASFFIKILFFVFKLAGKDPERVVAVARISVIL